MTEDKRGGRRGFELEEYFWMGAFLAFIIAVVGIISLTFGPDVYYAIQDKIYPPEPQPSLVTDYEVASSGCFDLMQVQQLSDGLHIRIGTTELCANADSGDLDEAIELLGEIVERFWGRRGEVFLEFLRRTDNKREWIIYLIWTCDARDFITSPIETICDPSQPDILVSERELIWLNK